jgi:hypothetical protein
MSISYVEPDAEHLQKAYDRYCQESNKSPSWKVENQSRFLTYAHYFTMDEVQDAWTIILCSNYRVFLEIQQNKKLFKNVFTKHFDDSSTSGTLILCISNSHRGRF